MEDSVFGLRRMLLLELVLTFGLLAVCSFTPGFFFVRRLRWTPLEKLCGSIGLSLVTRLAPFRLASLFMGLWFLATAAGELLAGQLAALTDRVARGDAFHFLGGQADFYLIFVVSCAIAALGLALLRPALRRRMHGRDT